MLSAFSSFMESCFDSHSSQIRHAMLSISESRLLKWIIEPVFPKTDNISVPSSFNLESEALPNISSNALFKLIDRCVVLCGFFFIPMICGIYQYDLNANKENEEVDLNEFYVKISLLAASLHLAARYMFHNAEKATRELEIIKTKSNEFFKSNKNLSVKDVLGKLINQHRFLDSHPMSLFANRPEDYNPLLKIIFLYYPDPIRHNEYRIDSFKNDALFVFSLYEFLVSSDFLKDRQQFNAQELLNGVDTLAEATHYVEENNNKYKILITNACNMANKFMEAYPDLFTDKVKITLPEPSSFLEKLWSIMPQIDLVPTH